MNSVIVRQQRSSQAFAKRWADTVLPVISKYLAGAAFGAGRRHRQMRKKTRVLKEANDSQSL
jgi:hypothetical protein